ncbi:uncharacterized protein LOC109706908 [Ananas comosus]|uniref:Uncharacterized protein LOC109706908 n=1 Tax=Ananas comosus TaxID=4615 RepID=A0A6P5EJF3_ANACO|nr:uncharacterized protein LOC109706908 [Ananas comosus]
MGNSCTKQDRSAALQLCKERMRFIKQAIDSRYALSAAQLSYVQSLRNVGTALRQFVEAETLIEVPVATSEPDKSPSHSSYASPSPSPLADNFGSPLTNESPLNPRISDVSFMRATGSASLKVTVNSTQGHFVEEDASPTFPFPPPPPDINSSWDFFDPVVPFDNVGIQNFNRLGDFQHSKEKHLSPSIGEKNEVFGKNEEKASTSTNSEVDCQNNGLEPYHLMGRSGFITTDGKNERLNRVASSEVTTSVSKDVGVEKEPRNEREDASEFITHRAKDFLTSMKDIESRFSKAADSGHEVSRMLETNKIRLSISSETIGKSSPSLVLTPFLICCMAENNTAHESDKQVITWKRSISSQSSSSRNPLISASRDDATESGSDFIEEFCMISGSHSSTLDRLYAWERKLYDELKSSESISKAYDRKCVQLRHQFARDLDARVIDKTRAVAKVLHSRLRVAIQTVDSISRRIERLRDEELQPQLIELIQGLIRMWRIMLETHHAQYITISLAYHTKSSALVPPSESCKRALIHLRSEMDCFGLSFSNWVKAHKSYVEALNSWLQKCVLPPQERSRGRKVAFSPRRTLAPPIFVLLREWLNGILSQNSDEVNDSIDQITLVLHEWFKQHSQLKQAKKKLSDEENETEPKEENKEEKCKEIESKVVNLQGSLTRLFDRLTKFAEAMLKTYEEVKQESEKAQAAYIEGRVIR